MNKKPFFYRIDLVDLMDFATEPEGVCMSLLTFAKELKSGNSQYPAIQKIIQEADKYIENKKKAGAKGVEAKRSIAQALLSTPQARNRNSNSKSIKEERMKDFGCFWDAYNYKQGKGGAEQAWLSINNYSEELLKIVIASAKKEALRRPQLVSQGRTPKMAAGWLNEKRWEDVIETPKEEVIF